MTQHDAWLEAALGGPATEGVASPTAAPTNYLMVPIRSLAPSSRERIAAHLLALEPQDRYLRFGYAASDEQVRRYVDQLDFERDDIYAIYNRRLDIIAMAHLAYMPMPGMEHSAEFGVSVAPSARGRGYGARLFDRAVMHARNAGVRTVYIHALTQNTAMLRIVRNAGAQVHTDGSESEAYLSLPEPSLDSRMVELIEQQYAEVDYQIKRQAQQFEQWLVSVQAVGGGVLKALSA